MALLKRQASCFIVYQKLRAKSVLGSARSENKPVVSMCQGVNKLFTPHLELIMVVVRTRTTRIPFLGEV
jgi:hypothetical protein